MPAVLRHLRSNVIAYLALFVALGGTSYAAVAINGSKLKNRSVAGAKLKKDTLGGTEIKEAALGKVPSAGRADSASRADFAGRAGTAASVPGLDPAQLVHGQGRVLTHGVVLQSGDPEATVLDIPGFGTVKASCVPFSPPGVTLPEFNFTNTSGGDLAGISSDESSNDHHVVIGSGTSLSPPNNYNDRTLYSLDLVRASAPSFARLLIGTNGGHSADAPCRFDVTATLAP